MLVSVAFAQPHQSPLVCFFLHGSSESNSNSGSGCPSLLFSRSTLLLDVHVLRQQVPWTHPVK